MSLKLTPTYPTPEIINKYHQIRYHLINSYFSNWFVPGVWELQFNDLYKPRFPRYYLPCLVDWVLDVFLPCDIQANGCFILPNETILKVENNVITLHFENKIYYELDPN